MSQYPSKAAQIINGTLPAYFSKVEKRESEHPENREADKMATAAAATGSLEAEAAPNVLTAVQELSGRLELLEKGLFTKLSELISPLTEKIDHLSLAIQKVNSVAEGAMDLSVMQQEDIKELQDRSETQEERLAIIGNRQRSFNLKFRAIEEKAEGNTDLIIYMANWLATTLDLQGEAYPVITQAFRLGSAKLMTRTFPRDIIVTFADIRVKHKILNMAKEKGFLSHNNDRVSVFLDLTPETLKKKKELKEITTALTEANLRFRWATPFKLQINHKGKTYFVKTEEEGYDVLKHLNVSTPMQTEKPSSKRKSDVLQSPLKTNKKNPMDAFR